MSKEEWRKSEQQGVAEGVDQNKLRDLEDKYDELDYDGNSESDREQMRFIQQQIRDLKKKQGVTEAAKGILHRVRYQYDDPSGAGIASGHITLHAPDKAAAARYAASDLSKKGKKNVKVLAVTPQQQGVAEGLPKAQDGRYNPDGSKKKQWHQDPHWQQFSKDHEKDPKNIYGGVGKKKVKEQGVAEAVNPQDTVTLDIPLMIRLLEYAREDAKTDMDLHNVAERLIKLSASGQSLSMDQYDAICPQSMDEESNFGYKKMDPIVFKAKQQFPMAKSDEEAVLMYLQDKEERDVDHLDDVNDREDAEINKLDREENSIERRLQDITDELNKLKSSLGNSVKEEVVPAVATAGGPAGATAPTSTTPAAPATPQQLADLAKQKAKLTQGTAALKTVPGVKVDPKMTAALQKADAGQTMTATDNAALATGLGPAVADAVSKNPQGLVSALKKAGMTP